MYNKFNQYNGYCKSNKSQNSPLSYAMSSWRDSKTMHGAMGMKFGKYSKEAQEYMSDKCSEKWDGYCEIASKDINNNYPNMLENPGYDARQFSAGQQLIRNTFKKRFLFKLDNCKILWNDYDPTNLDTQKISTIKNIRPGYECIYHYLPTMKQMDEIPDKFIQHILNNPDVIIDYLINMHYTIINYKGTDKAYMDKLKGYILYKKILSKEWFLNMLTSSNNNMLKLIKDY